jgi:hypothetical protein
MPPIELPRLNDDEQEELELQTIRYNKAKKKTFKNHIKLTKLKKEHRITPILQQKDGFHLNERGGLIVAQTIAEAIQKQAPPTETRSKKNDPPTETIHSPIVLTLLSRATTGRQPSMAPPQSNLGLAI